MFVRATRVQSSPDRLEQAIGNFQREVVPQVRKLDGFAGAVLCVDRSSGAALSATFWQSQDALQASEQPADAMRAQVTQASGATVREVDRFELVVQERSAPAQANTFVRVNDIHGSPDKVDAAIQFVRDQVVPALKQQRGFRAVVMGVNRQTGRMFVNSIWASAADRDASDAVLRDLRRQGGQIAGAERVQVELYEVVFAEMLQTAAAGRG